MLHLLNIYISEHMFDTCTKCLPRVVLYGNKIDKIYQIHSVERGSSGKPVMTTRQTTAPDGNSGIVLWCL